MPNVLGYLRHFCPNGEARFAVMGAVDRKGESISWGLMLPGGPDPSQYGFTRCPFCIEEPLPQWVRDWEKAGDPADRWSPFGIGDRKVESEDK